MNNDLLDWMNIVNNQEEGYDELLVKATCTYCERKAVNNPGIMNHPMCASPSCARWKT